MANKKNRIRQDVKGEWYCTECGKAGFKSKQSGNSHLTSCTGIAGLSHQMVASDHHQVTTTTTTRPLSVVNNPAVRSAISAMIGSAPVLAGAVDGGMEMMRVQNAELMNRLENVERLAGNHIGHLSGAMAGPANFFESPTFKWVLVGLGVIALFFLLEKGDNKTKQTVGSKILDLAIKKI
jgi:hypothetical protein